MFARVLPLGILILLCGCEKATNCDSPFWPGYNGFGKEGEAIDEISWQRIHRRFDTGAASESSLSANIRNVIESDFRERGCKVIEVDSKVLSSYEALALVELGIKDGKVVKKCVVINIEDVIQVAVYYSFGKIAPYK